MSRPSVSLSSTAVLALTLAVAACAKPGGQAAAGPAPAASSTAPVQWDYASNDPAKNPNVANKEGSAPGYNP